MSSHTLSLKIISFLSLQMTQIVTCQINRYTLFNFLDLTSLLQRTKCTNKLSRVMKFKSSQVKTLHHTINTRIKNKNSWFEVSPPLLHNTQSYKPLVGNTLQIARFACVRILSRSRVHEKETTLDGAEHFKKIQKKTLLKPNKLLIDEHPLVQHLKGWSNWKTPPSFGIHH